MAEWPLLIFTICLQAAIGGTLMLAIFYKQFEKLGKEKSFSLMKGSLVVIAILSVVGLGAAFVHLGTPTNAFNTIMNLGSSWQSREILVTGLFIGAVIITVAIAIVQKRVNFGLVALSAVIGLVDIYCMAAIYTNTLVSGWNSINTYTSFYGTAFVLGPILVVCCMTKIGQNGTEELAQSLTKNAFLIALAGVGLQLIGLAVFSTSMPGVNMIAGINAMTTLEGYSTAIALRWVIELVGIAVLGHFAFAKKSKTVLSFGYVALAALLVAEGMSRYVFYVLGA